MPGIDLASLEGVAHPWPAQRWKRRSRLYGSSLDDGLRRRACSSAVEFTTGGCISSMQSECPIAKEASTTTVDLTTLIPARAVLCGAAPPSASRPNRAHDCGLDSATPPELSCRDCGANDQVFVSFHGQGSPEHVTRLYASIEWRCLGGWLYPTVRLHTCAMEEGRSSTPWLLHGREYSSLWYIPRWGGGVWRWSVRRMGNRICSAQLAAAKFLGLPRRAGMKKERALCPPYARRRHISHVHTSRDAALIRLPSST